MARKLKSDRVLFITTILLVGLSIVMVYSASAVVALERYQRPYLFFIAALLERRMSRINEAGYALLPIGVVVLCLTGLILLEPDFGTAMSLILIAAVMVFAAGINYRYIVG